MLRPSVSAEVCGIEGCGSIFGAYEIIKGDRTVSVCRSCMEEMVALYAWAILTAPRPTVTAPGREKLATAA